MPKYRPKLRKPISNKQWIQYGAVVVLIGGGLYLNFNDDQDEKQGIDNSPSELVHVPSTASDGFVDEEAGDSSLQPPINGEEASPELLDTKDTDNIGREDPLQTGASLNEYNPTRLWLDPPAEDVEPELGELGEHHFESLSKGDEEPPHEDISPNDSEDVWNTTSQSNGAADETMPIAALDPAVSNTASTTLAHDAEDNDQYLSTDIERLAQNRSRIEQRVRRGQIPPSQRDEILRSEDFNAVIASIGRRVGEAWYYEGDDHADHGAILGIELGSEGTASDIRIRRSSGNPLYNNSVLQAAEQSVPFVEIAQLSSTAQTLLNPFSLTFGSIEAIEAYEATWERQKPIEAPGSESAESSLDSRAVAQIKREMRSHWPSNFSTGVDHDVSLQVTLAIPLGNVATIDFLRASNNVDLNDRIYQLVRNMPAFSMVRDLSLDEQQAARQFNLHVTPTGTLR